MESKRMLPAPGAPRLITVSGPSGAGKTTVVAAIRKKYPEVALIQSVTTRAARANDMPGEFEYVTGERFAAMYEAAEFAWVKEVDGNRYATRSGEVERVLVGDFFAVAMLTPDRVEQLYIRYGARIVPIFFDPLPRSILIERLMRRGDDAASIERRIRESAGWLEEAMASRVPYAHLSNAGTVEQSVSHLLAVFSQFVE